MADKQDMEVLGAALSGMQNAQNSLNKVARQVATISSPESADSVDLSSQMVALLTARNDFQANAKVVHVAEDMQKSLLDVLA